MLCGHSFPDVSAHNANSLWAESASHTVTSYISGFIAGCNFPVRLFSDCTYLGVLLMCVCDPL